MSLSDPKLTSLNWPAACDYLVSLPAFAEHLGRGSRQRIILNDFRH